MDYRRRHRSWWRWQIEPRQGFGTGLLAFSLLSRTTRRREARSTENFFPVLEEFDSMVLRIRSSNGP
jgi:hypothetical protein